MIFSGLVVNFLFDFLGLLFKAKNFFLGLVVAEESMCLMELCDFAELRVGLGMIKHKNQAESVLLLFLRSSGFLNVSMVQHTPTPYPGYTGPCLVEPLQQASINPLRTSKERILRHVCKALKPRS